MARNVCRVTGCEEPVVAFGYCHKHDHHMKKYGRIVSAEEAQEIGRAKMMASRPHPGKKQIKPCAVRGCYSAVAEYGYCPKHLHEWMACGRKPRGTNTGRRINGAGYMMIKDPTKKNAGASGYIREHILVMEAYLGRKMWEGEVCHHINGMNADNAKENLAVFGDHSAHIKYHSLRQWGHKADADALLRGVLARQAQEATAIPGN